MPRRLPGERVGELIAEALGIEWVPGSDPELRRFVDRFGRFFRLNDYCADRGAYAKFAVAAMLKPPGVIFSMHDWGVWPSGEVPQLLPCLRAGRYPSEPFDFRTEFIESEEEAYCVSLVACAFWNLWGFCLIREDPLVVLYVDDDEWMAIAAPDEGVRDWCAHKFVALNLEIRPDQVL